MKKEESFKHVFVTCFGALSFQTQSYVFLHACCVFFSCLFLIFFFGCMYVFLLFFTNLL